MDCVGRHALRQLASLRALGVQALEHERHQLPAVHDALGVVAAVLALMAFTASARADEPCPAGTEPKAGGGCAPKIATVSRVIFSM